MNKQGGIFFMALFAIIYFLFGMTLYQFLKPEIAQSRIDLSCTSPDTSGDMVTCLIIGSLVPIVVITILSISGGFLTERFLK